ncbi:MAG: amino acid permease [Clostridia bacterium]|nr:amino acid permease [Clostridia bacterium]
MKGKLEEKYGLLTAICMVIGIVIGSGVFFKAQKVLTETGGNVLTGVLAWIVSGLIMLICAITFSSMANKFQKVNGIVDYAEATVGKGYAYFFAWFVSIIYYPAMTSVLAWVSARYTLVLFGCPDTPEYFTNGTCLALACFYLVGCGVLNGLAPKLSGKFQVSTTFIKLVPLILIAIVGTVVGLSGGNTVTALSGLSEGASPFGTGLFSGVVATVFAYEGWIIATTINAELKNSKRNLPIALLVGCSVIVAVYVLYFIGLAGAVSPSEIIANGAPAAFRELFGTAGATFLNVFVVISCLGTLNGLTIGCSRGMYSIAARRQGPRADVMGEVSPSTNMPTNSTLVGMLVCSAWLFYFYGANLRDSLFGYFTFDSSEIPIVTVYALYVPIFVMFILRYGKENIFRNIVMPILAILGSGFMVFATVYAHGITPYQAAAAKGTFSFPVLFYLIVFAVIMAFGMIFYRSKNNKE